MKTQILAGAVGMMVVGLATAQVSERGITSIQPGQTLCIRAYRLPGTPDLHLERRISQEIEKHKVFKVVDQCSHADLTLLLQAQYHKRHSPSAFAIHDSPKEYRGGVKAGSATASSHFSTDDPFEFEAGQWLYVKAMRISGQSDLRVQANLQEQFRDYPFFSVTCSPVISQIGLLVLTEYHFKEAHQSRASKSSGSRPDPPEEYLHFATGYAIPVDDFLRYTHPALNLDALREAAVWHARVGSDRTLRKPENRSRMLAERLHTHARYQESLLASK